jgi:hypothetical protein
LEQYRYNIVDQCSKLSPIPHLFFLQLLHKICNLEGFNRFAAFLGSIMAAADLT